MSKLSAHIMEGRGLLQVGGADARSFLQGIVSNDVERVTPERAIWAAFLTPQGKYLHDFLMAEGPEGALLLDCEAERRSDLLKRLKLFKLRSKVELSDRTTWSASCFGATARRRQPVCRPNRVRHAPSRAAASSSIRVARSLACVH